MRLLPLASFVMTLLCVGCTVDRGGLRTGTPDSAAADAHFDGESADANRDDGPRADAHAGGDGAAPRDSGTDAALLDATLDAGVDATLDAGVDATLDAGVDATLDAGVDAEPEAGLDASADAGTAFCDPADPDLVACFRFEGSFTDGSSYGNDLSAANATFGQSPRGQAAVTSDSTSLVAADDPSLDLSEMTLELWVRPDTLPTSGRAGLLDKGGAYGLFIHPGGDVECKAELPMHVRAVNAVDAGTWTHVACTYDGSVQRLYIDGTLREQVWTSNAIPSTDQALNIAENGPGGDEQLIGRIDELRIWNATRTAEQLAQAANR